LVVIPPPGTVPSSLDPFDQDLPRFLTNSSTTVIATSGDNGSTGRQLARSAPGGGISTNLARAARGRTPRSP